MPPRDFPPVNLWRLIGKNEARKKVNKLKNEDKWNEENGKKWEKNEKVKEES